MKVTILYGSTSGNTAAAAEKIKCAIAPWADTDVRSIAEGLTPAQDADLLILGVSTWGIGELQDDWLGKEKLTGLALAGKHVAVFGTGDQMGFGDSFVDAIGILADAVVKAGAALIGQWPGDGYEFSHSAAFRDDMFLGLPLDEDNQPDLTEQRIADWTAQLREEVAA